MIYLLDQKLTDYSHSNNILQVIKNHTLEEIQLVEIGDYINFYNLYKIVQDLLLKVHTNDIVVCPWVVNGNYKIDQLFEHLAERCWVIAAAGNLNQDIFNWSPARADKVITVGCLNKSGKKASLSNYSSEKNLIWIPGTNYSTNGRTENGTSISAAIYAAFLSEYLRQDDPDFLEKTIQTYIKKVSDELKV